MAKRLGLASDEVRPPSRLTQLSCLFLSHSLAIAQAWAALAGALRDGEYSLQLWIGEANLRASYDHVHDPTAPPGRPTPVLPDAHFTIRRADGLVRSYFLEIDLGTQILERFRRRIRGYELYRGGPFQRRFGAATFSVLVVAESSARLDSLSQGADSIVAPENRGRYFFGTTGLLRPEGILGASWSSLGDKPLRLLEGD